MHGYDQIFGAYISATKSCEDIHANCSIWHAMPTRTRLIVCDWHISAHMTLVKTLAEQAFVNTLGVVLVVAQMESRA